MRFLSVLLFLALQSGISASQVEERVEIKLRGARLSDGRVCISTDEEGCNSVLFLTKAMVRVGFDENLTTCPINQPDGHGVLLLRGVPLNKVLGFQLGGEIQFEDIQPWSYERVVELLIKGPEDEGTADSKVKNDLVAGLREATDFMSSHWRTSNRADIIEDPMDFLVSSLRRLMCPFKETQYKGLDQHGPTLVGFISGIAAYMNAQLTDKGIFLTQDSIDKSFVEAFAERALAPEYRVDPRYLRILNVYYNMLIGHGMNLSTSALVQAASSGGEIVNILDVALRVLDTPNHGRAALRTHEMFQHIKNEYNGDLDGFLRQVEAKQETLFGFGHRIYKRGTDPRADVMEVLVNELRQMPVKSELLEDIDLALRLKEAALQQEYVKSMGWQPNVDYFASLILRGCGIDPRLSTVMFAASRVGSWVADLYHYGMQPKRPIKRPQDNPIERNPLHQPRAAL